MAESESEFILHLRQDGLSWNAAGDEVVILDLQGSLYLKVNGSGRVLWDRLAESCTEADLIAALLAQYDIDLPRATEDVAKFLSDLRRRDLLRT